MTGKLKQLVRKVRPMGLSRPDPFAGYRKESWSQSGEDIIVDYLLKLRKIEVPLCLDIGAYHPVVSNNTYKFFLRGSRVVNIDANPAAVRLFSSLRPSDVNLNIGIGAEKGVFDLYLMDDDSLNTFSADEMQRLKEMGHALKGIQAVDVLPINVVLEQYFSEVSPDFISIDAEGVDLEIIRTYDFKRFAAKVVCIETINYTPDGTGTKRLALCGMLESQGFFEYANTNINSIYVNKAWWFANCESLS